VAQEGGAKQIDIAIWFGLKGLFAVLLELSDDVVCSELPSFEPDPVVSFDSVQEDSAEHSLALVLGPEDGAEQRLSGGSIEFLGFTPTTII
jgi:hypothetical protein